jgi:hypothetical protein
MIRGEKRKDLDGDEWGKKCKDDFAELARMARETVKKRKVDVAKSGEGTSVEGMRAGRSRSSQEETIA